MSEQPPFGETVDHSLTNSGAFPAAAVDPPEKPHVHLREPLSEGVAPVNSPGSPEIPDAKSPSDHPPGLQLLGEIARGGMGAILKGRDLDLGRELAVKVLLEAHRGQPEMTRRFLEEAQISGQLQHPGIAPVHELGVLPDGRPFFTMKLVKGQTLAALLAARKDVRDDRPRWLGVFAQICQTLAYAHARGVIHRDLKPSNVMVGAFGEVQVMDWGLAKVLQEGGAADERKAQPRPEVSVIRTARSQNAGTLEVGSYTRAGTLLGTPAYLAPEQARGEVELVDERADVFGLGAILCEVLTGRPPFTGKSAEAQHKAQGARLDDAHARLELCGADAELIALAKRCLMAEPWDRPRHASEVAEQVTAYQHAVAERLRQAEVARAAEEARVVEARATAAQERKARRMTLALAASVLLTLLLGGGGWLWLHSQRAAKLADNNRAVNEALTKASGLREQARTAQGRAALDLTVRAREQARRAEALVEGGPVDAALAERMRELLAELEAEEVDRQFLAAVDTSRLAQTESSGGRERFTSGRAVPRFREAFRAYGMPAGQGEAEAAAARLGKRPAAVREAALTAVDEWIDLAENPALKVNEPHVAWLRALLAAAEPEGWEKQVRDAAAKRDAPKRREALRKLAANADVVHLSAHALTRLAQRLQSAADRPSAVRLLRRAWTHHADDFWINEELGTALQWENRHAEAQLYLSAAVALRSDSMGAHLNLGFAFKNTGKLDEAVAECLKAIELDPNYVVAHVDLALTLNDQGKPAEAIVACRKAIELDPRASFAHDFLGCFLRRQGKWDEAIAEHRKAIELKPKNTWFHLNLGFALRDARKLNEAVAAYRKAVEINPQFAWAYENLGSALRIQGKWDEAIAAYRKWVELEPKNASAYVNLGVVLRDARKLNEAVAAYHKAVEIDPKLVSAYPNLGYALRLQGKWDEAIAAYRKWVELEPKNASAYVNLGNILRRRGQRDKAIAAYRKAIGINPQFAWAYDNLGYALRIQGKWDEAVAAYRKAVELEPKNAWLHLNLGFALRNNRKLDEAVAECRKAVELDPKNAIAHFDLGIALSLQKKLG